MTIEICKVNKLQSKKRKKSRRGRRTTKKKEGNAPRDKRIFEIIRQRIFT
jgi:hypothetical protein